MHKNDFPLFAQQRLQQSSLVYLDSAATTQKPKVVLEAMQRFYECTNANVHRGLYRLSQEATEHYEGVRAQVAAWLGAASARNIVFTKGATEAINLVAHGLGAMCWLGAQDEIIISWMEHHANIVPWQQLCARTGATLKVIRVLENGELDVDHFHALLSPRTRLVAITHVSNVLGTINPLHAIVKAAHAQHVPVLVDGAQAVPHQPVDVAALDCDFYVFSAHKMYGPMGVGVLYAKQEWLERLPPYQTGGDMIDAVRFDRTDFAPPPHKFEAGTPNVPGVIGLGAAIAYLEHIGFAALHAHENALLQAATAQLLTIPDLRILGAAAHKVPVISFTVGDIHAHDVGSILEGHNIAVRAGHHCAMPLMERYQIPASVRVSFGIYNEQSDIEKLMEGLEHVQAIFKRPSKQASSNSWAGASESASEGAPR